MCGIVGIWQAAGGIDPRLLKRMREALVHRGPDADGTYVSADGCCGLAFRRLSIIDLSAGGNQPIVNTDVSKTIVFNGELYNYRDLRSGLMKDGYSFRSQGDAEVVLNAFDHFGSGCLERFHGMYAFAVWDERNGTLFLARDRLGIKPLYYYWDGHHFIFASELKALLRHPAVSPTIDEDALDDYLAYGYVPHDKAIIRGIRKLPAAHTLTFEHGSVTVRRYWEPLYRPRSRPEEEIVDELRERARQAVRLWSVSDVPVGVFLSGGLDSSSVCGLMERHRESPVSTFTIGFDDERTDETGYARMVADACGTDHKERRVTIEDARVILPRLAEVYDEPFFDSSAIPTLHVSEFARKDVKVVLAGDGGDELFFGYGWYSRFIETGKSFPFRSTLRGTLLERSAPVYRRLPGLARLILHERKFSPDPVVRYFRMLGFFDDWERDSLRGRARGSSGRDALWLFRRFFDTEQPLITALRLLDLQTYLVDDILTKVDRASMAHSLEVRTPLLDHSLVEFILTIPVEDIYRNETRKYLLKRAMEGILPPQVLERRKKGFSAPVRYWLRGDRGRIFRKRVLEGYAVRDGIFSRGAIRAMIRNVAPNRWAKLWMLLMFEGWYRRWVLGLTEEESAAGAAGSR